MIKTSASPAVFDAPRDWDAIVVGAGPSGALAARELAAQGAQVLLVDKAAFPRYKVCGCCLNGAALAALRAVGLDALPAQLGAVPLTRFKLHTPTAACSLDSPRGHSLSRQAFDTALVEAAVAAGAFLPLVHATVGRADTRGIEVALRHGHHEQRLTARVALVADGLAGRSLIARPEMQTRRTPNSRIGAGALLAGGPAHYTPGTIFMACGCGGYAGLVRLEDRRLNVAAAFDLYAVRDAGGPGPLAARLIREAGLPVPELLAEALWHGTPALTTSRARLAAERLFVLGDAAGYVEPFTGEGMAWALRSAAAVAPLALEAVAEWRPALARRWETMHRQIVGRRQLVCSALTGLLRYPALANAGVGVLSHFPWLAAPLVRSLNGGWRDTSPRTGASPGRPRRARPAVTGRFA